MIALKCLLVLLIALSAAVLAALIWQYVKMKREGKQLKYQLAVIVVFTVIDLVSIVKGIQMLFSL